jgi:hypothetical protein
LAATPPSEAPSNASNNPPASATRDEELTEAQFLQRHAEQAKQAMSRAMTLIGQNLGHSADPRAWTKEHPVVALTAAAVGGFVAVNMIPTRQDRAARRIARIMREELAAANPYAAAAAGGQAGSAANGKPKKHGILATLIREVLRTAQPVLLGAITSMVSAKTAVQQHQRGEQEAQADDLGGSPGGAPFPNEPM